MKKTILWDFDGVILDSMPARTGGFREVFKAFDPKAVGQLVDYHLKNGGLSRYVKIKYFFNEVLKEELTDAKLLHYTNEYSLIMRDALVDKKNLIEESLAFIKGNNESYNFHIVSGSDQNELRYLCKELGIAHYFNSIYGSPTPKSKLISELIKIHSYSKSQLCLIGDSHNDYQAAEANEIKFYGFNNLELKSFSDNYINDFTNFTFE